MLMTAIREWFERLTTYDNLRAEREIIEAERRDVLLLLARLDQAERRIKDKEQQRGPSC